MSKNQFGQALTCIFKILLTVRKALSFFMDGKVKTESYYLLVKLAVSHTVQQTHIAVNIMM